MRAARVFAAWVNHDDSRANNTLDMIEGDGKQAALRHYMFDFGSIMGSATTGPDNARAGRSYLIDAPTAWRALQTFGLWAPAWARRHIAPYHPSVGPFTADGFEPAEWKAEYPNAAFVNMRADDAFWGARRVAAFTDAQLRLVAAQGRYSDPAATAQWGRLWRVDATSSPGVAHGVTPLVTRRSRGLLRFDTPPFRPARYRTDSYAYSGSARQHTGVHTRLGRRSHRARPEARSQRTHEATLCPRARGAPATDNGRHRELLLRRDGARWTQSA